MKRIPSVWVGVTCTVLPHTGPQPQPTPTACTRGQNSGNYCEGNEWFHKHNFLIKNIPIKKYTKNNEWGTVSRGVRISF